MAYTSTFNLITGIISIIGGVITTWLCYRIYKFNRVSKWWIAVIVAFILIIIRRFLGFASDFKLFSTENLMILKNI